MINFGGIKEELKLSMAGECENFRKVNEIKIFRREDIRTVQI